MHKESGVSEAWMTGVKQN